MIRFASGVMTLAVLNSANNITAFFELKEKSLNLECIETTIIIAASKFYPTL